MDKLQAAIKVTAPNTCKQHASRCDLQSAGYNKAIKLDVKANYLSYAGAGFSIAPHCTQSAYFRSHNKAEGIGNLFWRERGHIPVPVFREFSVPPRSWIGSCRVSRNRASVARLRYKMLQISFYIVGLLFFTATH